MVDVAHHRHHRGAGLHFGLVRGIGFLEEGLRIIQLGRESLVAHFLDHDHGRFLVQLLVDRHHLAQLHQLLDNFRSLDGHLVRQVAHADGFRHMDFIGLRLGRSNEA
jgi:hypothetical protein